MSDFKIYHNPKCSKSREALKLLNDKGVSFEVIEYLKTPLSEKEIQNLLKCLQGAAANLVRTKEVAYQENPFDLNSSAEISRQLALKPHLMERPVVVSKNKAVIGRPLENIMKLLETSKDSPMVC